MSADKKILPDWFVFGDKLIGLAMMAANERLAKRACADTHLAVIPQLACIHLAHCLETSIEVNKKGRHAVAIALIRQCVEALTVVDIGLQNPGYGDPLLHTWDTGGKSAGEFRKQLETDVWPRYGSGLWSETWSDFYRQFSSAVQPYAHYGQELQGWQIAVLPDTGLVKTPDGKYQFYAATGYNTYDPSKATRITLLHCLLGWVIGRILIHNGGHPSIDSAFVEKVGLALSQSDLLSKGRLTWHQEFWPFLFDKPQD